MREGEAVFRCLNCGQDTGCANKLICDMCRDAAVAKRRRDFFDRKVKRSWFLKEAEKTPVGT